jgi:hypothetical protein
VKVGASKRKKKKKLQVEIPKKMEKPPLQYQATGYETKREPRKGPWHKDQVFPSHPGGLSQPNKPRKNKIFW